MKLYTKGGDKGHTSLIGGERVAKSDLRVEAYGSVDELSAFVALLGDMLADKGGYADYVAELNRINSILMSVEALLAIGVGGEDKVRPIGAQTISWIEGRIDAMQEELQPITTFTIPGGSIIISQCHVCRTVCRRAERAAIRAAEQFPIESSALVFINRLSDYFYALGRLLTQKFDIQETAWIPEQSE